MKKLLFSSILFILFTGMAFSQTIKKGNLLGIHIMDEMNLKPGVTIEQVEDFFINKYIPEFQKQFSKIKMIPIKGIRGEDGGKVGAIMILKSESDRAIYWNEDGSFNEKGKELRANLKPVVDELNKMMTSVDAYTDWLVK